MKREFDWERFKTEKIAVHCKTEEEAKDFCREMHEQRMKWKNCGSYVENTNYDVYPGKMCYYSNGEYSSLKFAEEHSLTILEWSDYMQREFTKADLKDGMVVEYCNGKRRLVLNNHLIGKDGYYKLNKYTEDMKDEESSERDIMRVFKIEIITTLDRIFHIENLELIWERDETKRMTLEEMRQKLEELTGEKIEAEPSEEEMIGVCYKYCSENDICDWCCIKKECEKNEKHDFVYYSTESLKECYEKVIANGK